MVVAKYPFDVRQQQKNISLQFGRHCGCRRIGVDIVSLSGAIRANRRNNRHISRVKQRMQQIGLDRRHFADKADVDLLGDPRLIHSRHMLANRKQVRILAVQSYRSHSGAIDKIDQFRVGFSDQRHFSQGGRFRVGYPQTGDKLRLLVHRLQQTGDFRSPAMYDRHFDASLPQGGDILSDSLL